MTFKLPEGWKEVRLGDVVNFNPRESIKKGTISKKVSMDKLLPFKRQIDGFEISEFKGGTKFKNGDTLLARITPCLENGKTAQVTILDDDEIGFGSTEYIVLREKPNLTKNNYIYYLAISPFIKEVAIKSMTGTSGRQRAQRDVIENVVFKLPSLKEQKVISDMLSALDDKIELNNKINENLEQQAQAIFKHWFIDFEFPDGNGNPYKSSGGEMVESELGMIPKEWEVKKIGDLCQIASSKRIFREEYSEVGIPFYRGKEIIEKSKGNLISTELFITVERYNEIKKKFSVPQEKDILLTSVGTLGVSYQVRKEEFYFKDGNLTWFKSFKGEELKNYIYLFLNSFIGKEELNKITIGSTQKALTITGLKNIPIVLSNSSILGKYDNVVSSILNTINNNDLQNQNLSQIRDALLPKLMSGEVRIPFK